MQDQRVGRGHPGVVVPDRPGVAARPGAHPREAVGHRAGAGAFDLRPGRAVPVHDQRTGQPAGVPVVPDRPGVAARAGAHPVEEVEVVRVRGGAVDRRPGRAVPVQDQRAGRPGLSKELSFPTAQASLPDTALTPSSWFVPAPGLGLVTSVQAVPFQWKISVPDLRPSLGMPRTPTAQASLPDTALTPVRPKSVYRGAVGLLTCVQAVPFQCTISAWDSPSLAR